jgi:predicted enzyme related to lactoylglutathione lyase
MRRTYRNPFFLASICLFAGLVQAQRSSPKTPAAAQAIAVAPQYDTSHVYVAPTDVSSFVKSFVGTFGGTSTRQVLVTVTPTPSKTTSEFLQTPVGTVSLFGFTTPIPTPFGSERTGYLVTDLDKALQAARAAGAEVVVAAFPDPIGRDAVVRFPGGVVTQLYWHTTALSYRAFDHVPENRVYVSNDTADAFLKSFLAFAHAQILSDEKSADGVELGRPGYRFRRVSLESSFGRMTVFVTDGLLPYPYGRETTGYEVDNLDATLSKATKLGASVLTGPVAVSGRNSAVVIFPGGYVAEIHSQR